jgi:hypothetical protein
VPSCCRAPLSVSRLLRSSSSFSSSPLYFSQFVPPVACAVPAIRLPSRHRLDNHLALSHQLFGNCRIQPIMPVQRARSSSDPFGDPNHNRAPPVPPKASPPRPTHHRDNTMEAIRDTVTIRNHEPTSARPTVGRSLTQTTPQARCVFNASLS